MEASSQDLVKSPQEIENGITSTQTVTWDPFTVLPKEIYLEIFDKLDNPDDKKNFMNAHMKWYALFKDKRTRFLFQDVFKEIDKSAEFRIIDPDTGRLRLVCRDWDLAVQNHFQFHSSNFTLDTAGRNALVLNEAYGLDGSGIKRMTKDSHFYWLRTEDLENDLKLFPLTHPPSKNPFLSRKLCLLPSFFGSGYDEGEIGRYMTGVDDLLKMYGQHIWHCTMLATDPLTQSCLKMAHWLSLMPNLKTLEVYSAPDVDLDGIRQMELVQPGISNLVVLKSSCLPSIAFTKLFGNLKELEKFQIQFSKKDQSFLKDCQVPLNRETLKEAYFTLNGLTDFFDYLEGEPFTNLKLLAIVVRKKGDNSSWPEWKTTFKILQEKLPALEDFCFKLPEALLKVDKVTAKNQSLEFKLNLGNPKMLWIALPNVASIDFLIPCKALEELNLVVEDHNFNNKDSIDVGKRERIKFNGFKDFTTLWESNVWDVFPKLRVLQVVVSYECGPNHCYRYEREGEQRKYKMGPY